MKHLQVGPGREGARPTFPIFPFAAWKEDKGAVANADAGGEESGATP